MAIPEARVLEVKEAADIVDVVSSYLSLRRAGANLKALCPFHEEKTPSFIVSPARQTFRCFGCGTGGDVYTFLMKQEGMDFPGAVRLLADRVGITVEEEEQREDRFAYRLVEFARKFYRRCLKETPSGKPARDYLEGRGMESGIADRFHLGYAPRTGRALADLARRRGLPLPAMESAGLLMRRDGEFRDRFRHRLMFPIADERGRTVGFGGRILGEGEPKYLNSPEGPLFSKGRLVYALDLARDTIRKAGHAVVVEGYTDVLRAHQEGHTGVVGCLGTAFTQRQASLLGRYTKRVVLVYDPDSAGVAASERGLDVLLARGLEVRVSHLPGGRDPFDFLRDEGAEAFGRIVAGAEDFFDFKLRKARARHDLRTAAGEAAAAREVVQTLEKVPDPIQKDILYRRASEALGIHEEALRAGGATSSARPRPRPAPAGGAPTDRLEEGVLEILLHRPDLAQEAVKVVPIGTYTGARRPVAEAIYDQLRTDGEVDLSKLFVRLKEEEYCRVLVEAQETDPGEMDYDRLWSDVRRKLQLRELDDRLTRLRADLDEAREKGDQKGSGRIFEEYASCLKEREKIRG